MISLTYDHQSLSEDELTVQLLGLRLLNSTGASVKLALSGYYQSAVAQDRDLLETGFLLDYLRTSPHQISVWRRSTKKQRRDRFGPGPIREALDKRDKFKAKKRQESYERLCEYATHPTYRGFKLIAPDGMGNVGPFFDQKFLRAWLEETAKLVVHDVVVLSGHFAAVEPEVDLTQGLFLRAASAWGKRYLGGDSAA